MKGQSIHLEQPVSNANHLNDVLASFDVRSRLAEAAELARAGRYGEAEEIVKTIENWGALPPALDLLARMSAQQGKVDDAAKFWEAAIKISPSNLSYQEGYGYVTSLGRPLPMRRYGLAWLWAGIATVLFVIAVFLAFQQLVARKSTSLIPDRVQLAATLYPATALPTAVSKATEAAIPTASQLSATYNLEQIPIAVSGFKTASSGEILFVWPEKDLFEYTWSLAPGTRPMLTALGRQLEPYSGKITISLVGFQGPYEKSDFFNVGLTRSNVVFTWLRDSTNLPASMFTIMPMETFMSRPHAPALSQIGTMGKSVLFVIQGVSK